MQVAVAGMDEGMGGKTTAVIRKTTTRSGGQSDSRCAPGNTVVGTVVGSIESS